MLLVTPGRFKIRHRQGPSLTVLLMRTPSMTQCVEVRGYFASRHLQPVLCSKALSRWPTASIGWCGDVIVGRHDDSTLNCGSSEWDHTIVICAATAAELLASWGKWRRQVPHGPEGWKHREDWRRQRVLLCQVDCVASTFLMSKAYESKGVEWCCPLDPLPVTTCLSG